MIPVSLARRLRDAGLRWQPRRGDAFVIPDRGMDGQVFVISDMLVDVHQFPEGPVLGFNGTVEWALDSVEQSEALWLPSETFLRESLGEDLVALLREAEGWRVGLADGSAFSGPSAEEAYALAVLDRLAVQRLPGARPGDVGPSGGHGSR